uniref:Uncharacterized protein n=1 Tax=Panagrolaimus davidi TaxID=227884 RepID=A0A914R3R1_9BILA
MKLLSNKKKNIKDCTKVDKAVQTDGNDPYLSLLILEKLPKFTEPSDENFNCYVEKFQIITDTKIDGKDKIGFLLATSGTTANIQTLRQAKQQNDQDFYTFTIMVHQMVKNIFLQQLGYTDAQRESETIRYAIRGAKKELKGSLKGTRYNNIEP